MSNIITGNGANTQNRLVFNGESEEYELWEIKFKAFLRTKKLLDTLNADAPDPTKNAEIFANLVMLLDNKSLNLIIRDASDNGKEAIKILREHYLGSSKPRIISLYKELANLRMKEGETCTDFIIRAETASTALKTAGETVSDSLLISMCVNGLPSSFNSFATIVTHSNDINDFAKFKCSLRNFEETESSRSQNVAADAIMNVATSGNSNPTCWTCGGRGHMSQDCANNKSSNSSNHKPQPQKSNNFKKKKRYCTKCRSNTHDTEYCYGKGGRNKSNANFSKDSGNNAEGSSHSYAFMTVSQIDAENISKPDDLKDNLNLLLVDTGASSHFVKNKSAFVNFDETFEPKKHFIELADGSKSNEVAKARGVAKFTVKDTKGQQHELMLHDALFVPSYQQNIFSVDRAIECGAKLEMSKGAANIKTSDGTSFNLDRRGKLYYLYGADHKTYIRRTLREWHEILGHCNVKDILKLENISKTMQISDKSKAANFVCDTCTRGKMVQYQRRIPDKRAGKPLEFCHSDLGVDS